MATHKETKRPTKFWEWADQNAWVLRSLLPDHVCNSALATCRITMQGPLSVGQRAKNWGRWFRMRMQTFGHVPTGMGTVQVADQWISTDSAIAISVLLDAFGLTLDNVFDHYGEPAVGTKMTIDLYDLVSALAPDFALSETQAVAAVA